MGNTSPEIVLLSRKTFKGGVVPGKSPLAHCFYTLREHTEHVRTHRTFQNIRTCQNTQNMSEFPLEVSAGVGRV